MINANLEVGGQSEVKKLGYSPGTSTKLVAEAAS
jgi:hypothetical protein